jgi:hypothetical protein
VFAGLAGVRVKAVESSSGTGGASVLLADGSTINARQGVVVATDGPAAAQLLGGALTANPSKADPGVGTCCLYFRCASSALLLKYLACNGVVFEWSLNRSSVTIRLQFTLTGLVFFKVEGGNDCLTCCIQVSNISI